MKLKVLTRLAVDWAVRCFGKGHVMNRSARAVRLAEEVIEYAQALGVPEDQMTTLLKTIYSRPPGKRMDELAQLALSLTVLAGAYDQDVDTFAEVELARVLALPPEKFAARNREKDALGLTGGGE